MITMALALSLVSACGSDNKETSSTTTGSNETTTTGEGSEETTAGDVEMSELENNTLSITASITTFGVDPAGTKVQDEWQNRMEEYLGCKLDITWTYTPWLDYRQNEQVILASGSLPDVFTYSWGDAINTYGEDGQVLNIAEYKDYMTYYPEFVAGTVGQENAAYNADGSGYYFKDGFVNTANITGAQSFTAFAYRFDALQENDLTPATNLEEFTALCAELKDLYPDSYVITNSDKNYAFYRGFVGIFHTWDTLYWNGTEWTSSGITDGTLGSTQDGDINLGSITPANHPKVQVNGKYGHAFRIGCSSVTTQAILDVAYWQWNYELEKCALLGNALFYDKTVGGDYTAVTPYAQYPNRGRVVFDADPLFAGSSLKAAYSYKNPQPGDYDLTFSDINTTAKTAKCQVNGGSDIGITCDNKTPNYQVIPGMYLIFNNASVLSDTDTTTIPISESIKYLNYAKDTGAGPDTYYNGDLTLNSTPVNGNRTFYHGYFPDIDVDCTKNTQYTRIIAYTA